ncbi:hypothetical protein [Lacrimispora sp.]|uniref:YxiF family protein n=1 Tax=Lacrimispora sp. TaxID=2719234 RepID=UPI0039935D68
MNPDLKKRKEELKINLNRKRIVEELSKYLILQPDSFLSVDETFILQTELFKKVDSLNSFKVLEKDISDNLKEVYSLKNFFKNYLSQKAVLFYHKSCDYGALEIFIKDFFENIEQLAYFTKFKDGYSDLILVDRELKFGLCVERNEYVNKLTYWI